MKTSVKSKLNFSYKITVVLALISLLLDLSFPQVAQAGKSDFSPLITGQLPLSGERAPARIFKVVLTAYSSTPDQTDESPFITANGLPVYDGLVAANWLPFGARVKFPELFGDKIFTVNDRMNPRYGRGRVDLWLDAPLDEVKGFGVKRAKMEVF